MLPPLRQLQLLDGAAAIHAASKNLREHGMRYKIFSDGGLLHPFNFPYFATPCIGAPEAKSD